jgi:LytS/YehU family sensor histidine kinase
MKRFSLIQQIGFWGFLFFSMIVFTQSELTLKGAVFRASVVGLFFAINFYSCYWLLTPRYLEQKLYVRFFLFTILMLVLVSLSRLYVDVHYLYQFTAFKIIDTNTKRLAVIVFTNIIVASFSVMLRLAVSRFEYENKFLQKEKEQISMELQFLKSQIHPHFLFNTLNNLYTLILQRSDKAGDALLKLSDLLRYLLYECEAPLVPLDKELEALRSFVMLHQLKYATPVNITIQESNIAPGISIEPMLLIPLLENAFKYSDIGINDTAYIAIAVQRDTNALHISVSNSVDPDSQQAYSQGGIGLKNVKRRIELSYGSGYEPQISSSNNLFEVKLKLPLA